MEAIRGRLGELEAVGYEKVENEKNIKCCTIIIEVMTSWRPLQAQKKLFFSEEMEVDEGGGDEDLQSTQGINTIDSQSIMNQKVSQSISVSGNLSIDC